MIQPHWEHFDHGADIGVRGIGPTQEEAFVQAALALTAVILDPTLVRPEQEVAIACDLAEGALGLPDWLNAVIFEMATRRMLFGRFALQLTPGRASGRAWGEPVDPVRHQPAVEVKGATYTELRVERETDGSWVAQCVVDV